MRLLNVIFKKHLGAFLSITLLRVLQRIIRGVEMEKVPAKVQIIIVAFLGILIFFGGIKYNEMRLNSLTTEIIDVTGKPTEYEQSVIKNADDKEANSKETKEKKELVVHVVGAVKNPGVYTFMEGDRINDAIHRAVPLETANLSELNMALLLQDGKQLDVPFQEVKNLSINNKITTNNTSTNNTSTNKSATTKSTKTTTKASANTADNTAAKTAAKTPEQNSVATSVITNVTTTSDFGRITSDDKIGNTDDKIGSTAQVSGKININTANRDQLMSLSRIGPALADRIIEYREKQGPFKSIKDITKVKGIGEATLAKFKDQITVE